MSKNKTKSRYDPVRALAVKSTAQHFGVTEGYVRMILSGGRSEDDIMAFYRERYSQLSKVLKVA